MSYVIYDPKNIYVVAVYDTEKMANRVLRNADEKGHRIQGRKYSDGALATFKVTSSQDFRENVDHEVTVISLNAYGGDPAPVKILASQRGGPCDPSTERYWSM